MQIQSKVGQDLLTYSLNKSYLNKEEVETPRSDAAIGLIIQNNGKKGFDAITLNKSGLLIDNEVKAIAKIKFGKIGKEGFVFAIINDKPKLVSFEKTRAKNELMPSKKVVEIIEQDQ